ncbi:MAG: molybdopterin molybdotransferase MoeA [Deltaproteobacteria bacterium]|nr:molybdopterin molybdotransferase MoeA [Deltaproteobacteria bacterium]
MISANEACKIIFEYANPTSFEERSLKESHQRFLAQSVSAPIDLPPFDNAAMDGHAVRSRDTEGASKSKVVGLKVVGTIAAGAPSLSFSSGESVRIMTGACVSPEADAVIPFEETEEKESFVFISRPVKKGENIRRAGEDVRKGDQLLEVGTYLTSRCVALLSASGISKVSIFQKPTVSVLSTGTELVPAGQNLTPGKIYDSNGPSLVASLKEIGITPQRVSQVTDDEELLGRALKDSLNSDVLITLGAVSAGDFDLIPKILRKLGATILIHKIAIKPGKPFLFAILDRGNHGGLPLQIFGLPGNPVSALMTFDRFVQPALLKMMGARQFLRPQISAVASEDLKGAEGKETYLRGIVEYKDGHYTARSAGKQGSAQLLSLAHANATLIIPSNQGKVVAGESVEAELLGDL